MALAVKTRQGEALVGGGLLLLAAYVAWEGARMPAGSLALPGPGFFPVALGVLLGGAAVGLLLRARPRAGAGGEAVGLGHRHIATALLALTGVALLLERLGFFLTMSLFLLALFRATSTLGWVRAAAAAALVTAAAHVLFHTVLGVPLP